MIWSVLTIVVAHGQLFEIFSVKLQSLTNDLWACMKLVRPLLPCRISFFNTTNPLPHKLSGPLLIDRLELFVCLQAKAKICMNLSN